MSPLVGQERIKVWHHFYSRKSSDPVLQIIYGSRSIRCIIWAILLPSEMSNTTNRFGLEENEETNLHLTSISQFRYPPLPMLFYQRCLCSHVDYSLAQWLSVCMQTREMVWKPNQPRDGIGGDLFITRLSDSNIWALVKNMHPNVHIA